MFPFVRLGWNILRAQRMGPLPFDGVHECHHRCMPWDLDMALELNNGRVLQIFDVCRLTLAIRVGMAKVVLRNRWGMTMAGSVPMYRKRVRLWDPIVTRSRGLGWDDKFFYLEQVMLVRDTPTSHVVYRVAVTDKDGLVRTDRFLEDMPDVPGTSPELPEWVQSWVEADQKRPWPPTLDGPAK